MGSSSPIFGVKMPKICELPPPRKTRTIQLRHHPSSLSNLHQPLETVSGVSSAAAGSPSPYHQGWAEDPDDTWSWNFNHFCKNARAVPQNPQETDQSEFHVVWWFIFRDFCPKPLFRGSKTFEKWSCDVIMAKHYVESSLDRVRRFVPIYLTYSNIILQWSSGERIQIKRVKWNCCHSCSCQTNN